jgi:phage I-like protein
VLNALDVLAASADAAGRRSEAQELVDGAVRDGRVPPAHRDFYLREALSDLRAAREVVNSLPVLTAPQPAPRHVPQGALTDGEEAVRRQLGLSAEQMIAARSE